MESIWKEYGMSGSRDDLISCKDLTWAKEEVTLDRERQRIYDGHQRFVRHGATGVACYSWSPVTPFCTRYMWDNELMGELRHEGRPGQHYTAPVLPYDSAAKGRIAYVCRTLGRNNEDYAASFIRDLVNTPLRYRGHRDSYLTGKATLRPDWLDYTTRHTVFLQCGHLDLSCPLVPRGTAVAWTPRHRPHWHLFMASAHPDHPVEGLRMDVPHSDVESPCHVYCRFVYREHVQEYPEKVTNGLQTKEKNPESVSKNVLQIKDENSSSSSNGKKRYAEESPDSKRRRLHQTPKNDPLTHQTPESDPQSPEMVDNPQSRRGWSESHPRVQHYLAALRSILGHVASVEQGWRGTQVLAGAPPDYGMWDTLDQDRETGGSR